MATHLFPTKGYDDARAFAPIGRVAETPIFLCTTPATGATTVAELVALAKRQPGKLSYASSGAGSSAHLATELFLKMADIDVLNVTYRGGAPAVQAIARQGDADGLRGRRDRAAADRGEERRRRSASRACSATPLAPDVPTIAEFGLPGFECSSQFALLAPAGTPEPVIRKLNAAMLATLKDPDILSRLNAAANAVTPGTPEEFPAYLATESGKWGEVIRTRGITAE